VQLQRVHLVRAQLMLDPMCCRHPFRKGDGWLLWAILGIILAPAVIALVATILSAANYDVRLHEWMYTENWILGWPMDNQVDPGA
jgi:hypothetical protein